MVEARGPHASTISIKGEEFHYMDFRDSFKVMPPRQREAVMLLCVDDMMEEDAARAMGFTSWPTPIQQYKNFGLKKVMDYLDAGAEERESHARKGARENEWQSGENPRVKKNWPET